MHVPGTGISSRRHRQQAADFLAADTELVTTLENLDNATNYAAWIMESIAPYLGDRIVEIGAGHGTFTERLREYGDVIASEPSPRAAARLRLRFANDERVTVEEAFAQTVVAHRTFNTAVSINVLEHVDDDVGLTKEIGKALDPGGHFIIFVPAFQGLYSKFDRDIGHLRRYRSSDLGDLVAWAGMEVELMRYVNLPGFFAWFLMCRALRLQPTQRWSTHLYDRAVIPVVRQIESKFAPPFGQSLLCVARRPSNR